MKPDSSAADSSATDHTAQSDDSPSPLETLQRRYADQLSQDIELLEAEKAKLQTEIDALRQDYVSLHAKTQQLRQVSTLSTSPSAQPSMAPERLLSGPVNEAPLSPVSLSPAPLSPVSLSSVPLSPTEKRGLPLGPTLPGEPAPAIRAEPPPAANEQPELRSRPLELPTPATSEQQRWQRRVEQQQENTSALVSIRRKSPRKGLVLSAIATLLIVWHYGIVYALSQGGRWLSIDIGELGTGFVPSAALLWLRMLIMVPAIVLLAPQLHRSTWEDIQSWIATKEPQLALLVGSGIALFFSQVLLYQSIGIVGPIVATALLFLYPLTAVPLGLWLKQEKALSPFSLLAIVAIAMGGLLVVRPTFSTAATPGIRIGLLASVALSIYIVLTNMSYRRHCHPMPVAVIQFSTVAALSSVVLLFNPIKLVNISWVSFCSLGIFVGVLMLAAYLFNYSSLHNIGGKTAIIAATTPLAMLILSFTFSPAQPLAIIQWTGVLLVSIGGIALGKEKLNSLG